jgi:cardiolipin synthase
MLIHLPNTLSVLRIALVPVLILLLKGQDYTLALIVFLASGLTDALDGFLAKRLGLTSRLGAILDPAADKILLVSAYAMLAVLEHIPFWLMLAVVFRDLLIVGGYLIYTSQAGSVQMRPSRLSKLNTLMQIALVIAVLAEQAGLVVVPGLIALLAPAVLATTVASGAHYLWTWGVLRDIETVRAPGEKRHGR